MTAAFAFFAMLQFFATFLLGKCGLFLLGWMFKHNLIRNSSRRKICLCSFVNAWYKDI